MHGELAEEGLLEAFQSGRQVAFRVHSPHEIVEHFFQSSHARQQLRVPVAHAGGGEEIPQVAQGGELLLVTEAGFRLSPRQGRVDDQRQIGEDLELLLLVARNVVRESHRIANEVQIPELGRQLSGCVQIGGEGVRVPR